MHEIINEKWGSSVDTAQRLAKFFETDLNLWDNLQAQYEADSMDAKKRTDMERIVPYSTRPKSIYVNQEKGIISGGVH